MIKTKPWTGGTDEEYETQHFGFGSQRLKIAFRQMVEEKIRTGIKDMESYLKQSLRLNETDTVTLTRSCDKIIRLYYDRAGPSLEIIDDEIERLLKIPSNVLLPEDEMQAEHVSHEECEKLKEEVALLRKRVERGALMEALLTAEEEEIASVEKFCEIAKKDLKVLDLLQKNFDQGDNMKSILNESQFLCASVPNFKENDDFFDDPGLTNC